MIVRTIAVFTLAMGLATSAFAQTTSSTDNSMPKTWGNGIGDTFFSDSSGSQLRSQDEVTTRWGKLSSDQQAQARSDCQKMYPSKGQTAVAPKTGADADRTGGMVTVCNWVSAQK